MKPHATTSARRTRDSRARRNTDARALRVLHVINRRAPESIPLELASFLPMTGVDVGLVVFYPSADDAPTVPHQVALYELDARTWYDRSTPRAIRRIVRQFEPDVVHVHHAISAVITSIVLARAGIPLVKSEHQDHRRQPLHQTLFNAVSIPLATALICNSNETKRSFYPWERLLSGSRVRTVHNGVNVDRVVAQQGAGEALRKKLGIEPATRIVGTVGRMVEQKNYERLIDGFGRLVADGRNIHLLAVGDGPLRAQLTERVAAAGLSERVTMIGSVTRDDVYAALDAIDVFVVPSLWEGFCNAAVEAAVAGLPIAAADIPTLREVLGDGPAYFSPVSTANLAAAIVRLLNLTTDARADMQSRMRERARARYSLATAADAYVATYRRIAGCDA